MFTGYASKIAFILAVWVAITVTSVSSFLNIPRVPSSVTVTSILRNNDDAVTVSSFYRRGRPLFGGSYVPSGMTPDQYKQLKELEKKSKSQKDYGRFGPSSFKSRSLQSFQKDLEKGKVRKT
jgi:hypothetical protein